MITVRTKIKLLHRLVNHPIVLEQPHEEKMCCLSLLEQNKKQISEQEEMDTTFGCLYTDKKLRH